VASKKTQRAIAAQDVPRVFDDVCIDRLAQIAEIPQLAPDARDRLGLAIREAARIYAEGARKPNVNAVHDEIARLHQAASRRECERLAQLIEALSPEVRERFKTREANFGFKNAGLKFPSADALRDPALRDEACDFVRRFCSAGGAKIEGRKRPSGKRSVTWQPLLYASRPIKHPPKREAERQFVMHLRLAWVEATGETASATVNPLRPGPFARFVGESLILVGAPHADAVGLINDLDEWRWTLSGFPTNEEKQLMRWEDDGGRSVLPLDEIVENPCRIEGSILVIDQFLNIGPSKM
jgi:hypothetical protein